MSSEFKKLLDPTAWRLLEVLQENARLSYSEIGRRVGLSTPAVIERIRKLEDAGVIRGYRVELDAEKLGYPITAFIRLESNPEQHASVMLFIKDALEVQQCYYITGRESFVLKVCVVSVGQLEAFIQRLSRYGNTATSLVMSTPVQNKGFSEPDA